MLVPQRCPARGRRRQDVILGGGSILAVTDELTPAELTTLEGLGWRVTVYDVTGSVVIPGLVDLHVHLTGGGRPPPLARPWQTRCWRGGARCAQSHC